MGKQSARQVARRSALDIQAVLRKERADRERRLEALAVEVLTALGERDALVQDAERRASQVLRTMTDDEGLSLEKRSTGAAAPSRCERYNPVAAARQRSPGRSRRARRTSARQGRAARHRMTRPECSGSGRS